ncbi:MAG: hypothetical protein K2K12_00090 [Clostridia bacterium]|nr:hypothetical protein [Clostridia bacterium]
MITLLTTILKSIFSGIKFCCKVVYQILKWLRIRLLALYLVVCGILQLAFHVFDGKTFVFWIGVAVCGCITLMAWVLYVRRKFAKSKVKRERPHTEEAAKEPQESEPVKEKKKAKERVKYYNVAGREGYVFAEYSDRYELYFEDDSGLTLVRTDYKNEN